MVCIGGVQSREGSKQEAEFDDGGYDEADEAGGLMRIEPGIS